MPLFIVDVVIIEKMPVYAPSKAACQEYMSKYDNWRRDSIFAGIDPSALVVHKIHKAKSGADFPEDWESDVLPWGFSGPTDGDEPLWVALYWDDEIAPLWRDWESESKRLPDDEQDASFEKAFERENAKKAELKLRFDKERLSARPDSQPIL